MTARSDGDDLTLVLGVEGSSPGASQDDFATRPGALVATRGGAVVATTSVASLAYWRSRTG